MQTPRHIYLIGFMGCGKSFWSKRLAQALDMPNFDLDEEITLMVGKSIPQIFQKTGESGFRILETQMLERFYAMVKPSIIASGGGTPCFNKNLERMKESGIVIYLKTDPILLTARLKQEKQLRPLLADVPDELLEDVIRQKLEQRITCYQQADYIVEQHSDTQNLLPGLLHICRQHLTLI